ncbi:MULTISPECIES: helix-turn-helix domain-containing protein [unclassified Streptomyces]|uniref:helix-turn-helix domain-containing protein n=1 Tax=unclassified Streptomyces TaxID=2593676 RepID=UPI0022592ECC|nr:MULTISPECIES: helix-turn-helix domain-containing protein [unclassified Streptomyces]MCX4554350.1 helix-turn-helix domain-containing protein [Streptomyces sp. NBC_01500]WSC25057.1 helix-turn-helix domain-containing protein [Streptomyces sp. NBC_01766]
MWEAVAPTRLLPSAPALVVLHEDDLVVIVLHTPDHDTGPVLRLLAQVAEQQGLLGGVAEPVPLAMLNTAWAQAGQARAGAAPGRRLVHATGLGSRALAHIVPPGRLAAWATALLHPLDPPRRRALDAWLRCGSVSATAHALGISCPTVRTRLRTAGEQLGLDLAVATTQAWLLIALHTPPTTTATGRDVADPARGLLHLVPDDVARDWATRLVGELERPLRIAVRAWLTHLGSITTTAKILGLHRATLRQWLDRAADQLAADLSSPTTRAELHLAIEAVAGPGDSPENMPRLGGRTYPSA